jgi:prepilin-type N-terminal cleavage/methylation domain-containing protein
MMNSIVRRLLRGNFTLLRGHKGFSLMEVLIALAILGAIGGGFSAGLSTGIRASDRAAQFAEADRLVRTQIEDIKNAPYDETLPLEYPVIDAPGDYSVSIAIVPFGDGDGGTRQTITVTISRGGQGVFAMDILKVKGL